MTSSVRSSSDEDGASSSSSCSSSRDFHAPSVSVEDFTSVSSTVSSAAVVHVSEKMPAPWKLDQADLR